MAIATDDILLRNVLEQKSTHAILIRNYAFGSDGNGPRHEIDLKVHYTLSDGRASVVRIEADNGKHKPCFEKIWLPEKVVNELEQECTADWREQVA